MRFPEDVSDDVLKRLRRIEGQVRGVQRLIEEGADCDAIVTQLAAVKGAVDRVSYRLMAAGMRHCAVSDDPDAPTPEEFERLFLRLS